MKKLFTILLFTTAFVPATWAQYSFFMSNAGYTDLAGATPIPAKTPGNTDTIPIGFTFKLAGTTGNTLYLYSSGGYTWLSSITKSFTFFGTELYKGSYSYLLEGAAGSRIFKLQGKGVGFGHDFSEADYVNFQVWLYEADSSIELHMGASSISNADFDYYFGNGGPSVGFPGYRLYGSASMPKVSPADTVHLKGTPDSGTVYSFTPDINATAGIETLKNELSVYPNPADGFISVSVPNGTIRQITITDLSGKVIATKDAANTIETSALAAGVYFLQVKTDSETLIKKIAIKH